ncbi:SUN2 isoform 11, partial [Pan troglodytes]
MSRRSQRLTRYSQGDDDGSSSSGGSSVAGSQSTLFKDSPLRTLKRKSSNMKRLSPAPQLGPSSDAHTSYYSESLVRESWFPPRSSLEELHGDANWDPTFQKLLEAQKSPWFFPAQVRTCGCGGG